MKHNWQILNWFLICFVFFMYNLFLKIWRKRLRLYYNVFLLTIAFFEIITLSTNKLRWCSKNPVIRMTIRLTWPHKNLNLFEKTRFESGNSYKLQFVEVGPVAEPHAGLPRWDAPPDKVLQVLTIRSKHFNIPSI